MNHSYDVDIWSDEGLFIVYLKWESGVGTECMRWLIPGTQLEDK